MHKIPLLLKSYIFICFDLILVHAEEKFKDYDSLPVVQTLKKSVQTHQAKQ
jgi:hypothetical protein